MARALMLIDVQRNMLDGPPGEPGEPGTDGWQLVFPEGVPVIPFEAVDFLARRSS